MPCPLQCGTTQVQTYFTGTGLFLCVLGLGVYGFRVSQLLQICILSSRSFIWTTSFFYQMYFKYELYLDNSIHVWPSLWMHKFWHTSCTPKSFPHVQKKMFGLAFFFQMSSELKFCKAMLIHLVTYKCTKEKEIYARTYAKLTSQTAESYCLPYKVEFIL